MNAITWLYERVCISEYSQVLLVEEAGLVGGHHVFDVYEGVLSPVAFKNLQGLLDQVSNILSLLLTVVNPITRVFCTQHTQTEAETALNWHITESVIQRAHEGTDVSERFIMELCFLSCGPTLITISSALW